MDRTKIKFIIVFLLVPGIFIIMSAFAGIYLKITQAIAILVVGSGVYALAVLKYGKEIVIEMIIGKYEQK